MSNLANTPQILCLRSGLLVGGQTSPLWRVYKFTIFHRPSRYPILCPSSGSDFQSCTRYRASQRCCIKSLRTARPEAYHRHHLPQHNHSRTFPMQRNIHRAKRNPNLSQRLPRLRLPPQSTQYQIPQLDHPRRRDRRPRRTFRRRKDFHHLAHRAVLRSHIRQHPPRWR